jgi:MFS family permease
LRRGRSRTSGRTSRRSRSPSRILDNGGGATAVGLSFAAWTLAQVAMLAFGGVVGDRVPRRVVMVGSDVASAVVRTAMGVLLISGHAEVWHLIALQACGGAAVAFYSPASYGLTQGGRAGG